MGALQAVAPSCVEAAGPWQVGSSDTAWQLHMHREYVHHS